MKRFAVTLLLALGLLPALSASAQEARLLRMPDVSATQVAFVFADDVWVAPRDGGEALRLTTFPGSESWPRFSPDGTQVAFSGEYDGNVDVYVVPVSGGEPRRLTWHPGPDMVRGWTPDGAAVLFGSGRTTVPRSQPRLWTIPVDGGFPTELPLPRAAFGSYDADASHLAYQVVDPWENEFRNYRGGQCQPIRVIDLKTLAMDKAPWTDSNDLQPVWLDGTVFFLSDRDWGMNVWAWTPATGALEQRTHFKEYDCKRLSGGHGRLVFENGGRLWTLDAAGGEPRALAVELRGDFPWSRPHWTDAAGLIREAAVSPTGQRALFEARGEIFSVPADKGDVRNLSRDPGAADRAPAWSPDGRHVSWFSDKDGEYALVIADQHGDERRTVKLKDPTFYYSPVWSPDSKHLAYGDADRVLWVMDVESGKATRIDDEGFAHPVRYIAPTWSPDSRWIAYSKRLVNQFNAIFVFSLESGKTRQVTDGLSDAIAPAWDPQGGWLAFLASTDFGQNVGWLDMTSYMRPLHRSVYAAVLKADGATPLPLESDEEPVEDEAAEEKKKDEKKDEKADDGVTVTIDWDGLDRRVVALPVPPRRYEALLAADGGALLLAEMDNLRDDGGAVIYRYDPESRETEQVLEGVQGFIVSADGKKLLYGLGGPAWFLTDAAGPKPGDGALALGGLRMKVDPQAEWKQMFREAWRYQRDYFYVENVHGLDLDAAWKKYAPWVDHARHRADLTYVLDILGGETSVGHSFVGGGDFPDVERVPVGLLGCDLEIRDGHYRIARIYDGESWNPRLRAPLSGPGLDVKTGDYLLAVNGVDLRAGENPYRLFDRTAGLQTVLTLSAKADGKDAREVTVVPVGDEEGLRRRAWIEDNRRKVGELSGGRLAYVWVPDTAMGGYAAFTREYFAQQDKQGAVIDERFNHGGSIADYMTEVMDRELLGYFNNPVGSRQPWTAPNAALWGPKVMLINEMSGSGGDMLPYMFRKKGIGPLIGTRTWGGLVGIWDVPMLIDGGGITAPRGGFFDTDGNWAVENEGVGPDIAVEQTPLGMRNGGDPQLERAVSECLELLKTQGVKLLEQPADPVRVRRPR
ncbi:MAG TPA: PDZ domain-containing protein [Candidatus Krumholzibacteria bacterium]|nr:PDZ domain-containing protein [Candidatus Krumholzibacteria bacterium]